MILGKSKLLNELEVVIDRNRNLTETETESFRSRVRGIRRTNRWGSGSSRWLACCWRLRGPWASRWRDPCFSSRPETVRERHKPCRSLWTPTSSREPLRFWPDRWRACRSSARPRICDASEICESRNENLKNLNFQILLYLIYYREMVFFFIQIVKES